MGDDQQRLFLTIAICLGIMLVWTWLFGPDHTAVAPAAGPAGAAGPATPGDPAAASPAPTLAAPSSPATTGAPATPAPADAPEEIVEREIPGLYRAEFSTRGARLKSFILLHPQYVTRDDAGDTHPVDMVPAKEEVRRPLAVEVAGLAPDAPYRLVKQDDRMLRFSAEVPGVVRVDKTFTLYDDRYTVDLTIGVTNLGAAPAEFKPSVQTTSWQDPNEGQGGMLAGLPNIRETVDVIGGEVERETVDDLPTQFEDRIGVVSFAGWNDRYFLFALRPRDVEQAQVAHRADGGGVFTSELTLPAFKLAPGESAERTVAAYIGPKRIENLEPEGDLLYEAVDFWIVGALARPMLALMKVFHGFTGNWGLAIILLTVLVKLLLLPLTNKSFKSMKAMQTLKPKMDKLREKHAADKERLNQEMLNLYKVHKINPLAGCLPMVLQMPVWIALYRTIWSSVELYQASFLWLPDLSSEDPSYVLPVLLGVVTFVQQKIQPAQMDATQQKIMMWMMPVMFTGFMLFLPSALVVYIFCNSLLTIIQQWYIKRGDT